MKPSSKEHITPREFILKASIFVILGIVYLLTLCSLNFQSSLVKHFDALRPTCPANGLTKDMSNPREGLGSIYLQYIKSYVHARINGQVFCVSPWGKNMDHGQNGEDMFEFVGGNSFGPRATSATERLQLNLWENLHVGKVPAPECFANEIRSFYYSTPKPAISFPSGFNLALHIRRGDGGNSRFTPNVAYVQCIDYLKREYPRSTLHIFSEGQEDDFEEIVMAHDEVIFHLNGDVKQTFHDMVSADVLVRAKGTFSYTASILNRNRVMHINDCKKLGRSVKTKYLL